MIDPEERVAWLTWCQRSWGVGTSVSGDDLAKQIGRVGYGTMCPPLARDLHVNGVWL